MSFTTKKQIFTALLGLALFATLLAFAGCKKGESEGGTEVYSTKSGGGGGASDGTGEGIYKANNCANCHSLGGSGGRMGPDLSKVGAESEHTEKWIAEHIKNPKAHKPNSRMPAYEGKINDKDLETLAKYLASQK